MNYIIHEDAGVVGYFTRNFVVSSDFFTAIIPQSFEDARRIHEASVAAKENATLMAQIPRIEFRKARRGGDWFIRPSHLDRFVSLDCRQQRHMGVVAYGTEQDGPVVYENPLDNKLGVKFEDNDWGVADFSQKPAKIIFSFVRDCAPYGAPPRSYLEQYIADVVLKEMA